MSSLIVCRILASNYQANNQYNRAGAKCPIFLVMIVFSNKSSLMNPVSNAVLISIESGFCNNKSGFFQRQVRVSGTCFCGFRFSTGPSPVRVS